MRIEYDPEKSDRNVRERGLSFEQVHDFDYDTAIFAPDGRQDYGETRINAIGYVGTRLHVLCFKPIAASRIRVISFRKANDRERKKYEKALQNHGL